MANNLVKTTLLTIPPVAVVGVIAKIIYHIKSDSDWNYNDKSSYLEKIIRTQGRGAYISTVLATSSIVQATMTAMDAQPKRLFFLYGFFYANIMGYLGDKVVGSEEGYKYLNEDKMKLMKYMMGSLTTPDFFRYCITVLLDMFISSVIQEILLYKFEEPICELKDGDFLTENDIFKKYVKFVGGNIDNILQSIVAVITFYAYTNQTRFLWAYPDNSIPQDKVIQTSTMQLSTVIAGIIFLASTFSRLNSEKYDLDKVGNPIGDTIGVKLIFVIIAITLLSLGSIDMFKKYINMTPEQKYNITFDIEKCNEISYKKREKKYITKDCLKIEENKKEINELDNKRVIIGSIIFIVLTLICLYGPFVNKGIGSALLKGTGSFFLVLCVMVGGFLLSLKKYRFHGIASYVILFTIFGIILSKTKNVDITCTKNK